jgi:predicted Zn-dependent peptidase
MAIQATEVDGVPTLIAPTAGQMHAGLVFRVGRADEPLSRTGLTHILEHLTLFPFGLTDYHYNGATGPVTTTFHTAGSEQDVASFLTKVCESLAALPVDRLETEKTIVRTEWSSRTPGVNESMPLWRYGARGYGILSFREPGTYALTADEVLRWRDTWFTRENAVLWIAGSGVPEGLRLPLPSGRRQPLPPVTSALPITPAYFAEGRQGVVFDAIVRSDAAATVYAEVLERTLFRDLRQEGGLSYSASATFEPRGDGYGTLIAAVDALPDKQAAVIGGFVDTLAKLKVGRIDTSDIGSYVAKAKDAIQHPDAEAGTLGSAAFALLTGRPVRGLEERMAELLTVTAEDVHNVALEAMQTALLQVPAGHRADWAGFAAAPTQSSHRVSGTQFRPLGSGAPNLVLGAEGITSTREDMPVTVRFDQVAAMTTWPDGGRQLIGHDGFIISVEPTLNAIDPVSVGRIDAAVPDSLTIRMPARDPSAIPQPANSSISSTSSQAKAPTGQKKGWEIALLVLSLVATTAVCCLSGMFSIAATTDDGGDTDVGWGIPIFSWLCTLVFLVPAIWLLIRWQRRR